MNIIFGKEEAEKVGDKYIVLELDTVTIRSSTPITVYCVVENMPFADLHKADPLKKLHLELMENYRKRNWNYCEQAIEHLMGAWGNEVDTFYDNLLARVIDYKDNEPADSWTGIVAK